MVMRSGALGDFVLTLPAINALRHHFPQAHITLVGRPAYTRLAHPTAVIDQDSAALAPLYVPLPLPVKTLDLFAEVDFILAYAADSDGVLTTHLAELAPNALVWDPRPVDSEDHMVDYLLTPIERLGIDPTSKVPQVRLVQENRTYATQLWREHNFSDDLIALHPGSGGARKCWPLARYIDLADALEQHRQRAIFLCGPADRALIKQLAQTPFPLICPPTPLDLAAVLERIALLVGNDSGPGHLAAALGVPTISLFGPTDPSIWQPRSFSARIIRAPDGQLAALAVDSVLKLCLNLLNIRGNDYGRPF